MIRPGHTQSGRSQAGYILEALRAAADTALANAKAALTGYLAAKWAAGAGLRRVGQHLTAYPLFLEAPV